MRVKVETARCKGYGVCAGMAPDVFDLDDAGHVVLLREDVPDELADAVRRAVKCCPEDVISVDG